MTDDPVTPPFDAGNILQGSGELLARVLDASSDLITIVRAEDAVFLYVNDAMVRATGYAREELVGHSESEFEFFTNPGLREEMAKEIQEKGFFEGIEGQYRRKDGTIQTSITSVQIVDIGGEVCVLSLGHDVSDRRETEEQLREAENSYQRIVEEIPIVTYRELVGGPDRPGTTTIYLGPHTESILGYTREEHESDPHLFWNKIIHPDDRERVREEAARANKTGEQFRSEYRAIAKDGRTVWLLDMSNRVSLSEDGSQVWRGVTMDITERKEAEEGYRRLVEQIPAVTYIEEEDSSVATGWAEFYISPQVESMLGHPREHWGGRKWLESLHPDDVERVRAVEARSSETSEPFVCEYRLLAADGHYVWVHDEAWILDDTPPRRWQGIMMDITDRKLAEEQTTRRERIMSAVAFASERFLRAGSWEECIDEVLSHLGEAAEVSRAYVFENHEDDQGRLLSSVRYEWVSPGTPSQLEYPENHGYPYEQGFERWKSTLGSGGVIQGLVRDLPESERVQYESGETRALVAVPIFVEDKWWGYLGMSEARRDREFMQSEVEALKAAAGTLGAAIQRRFVEERLHQVEVTHRTLIERMPAFVYLEATDENNTDLYMSPQYEQIFGYPLEERLADPGLWERLIIPEDLDYVQKVTRIANETGEPYSAEYRIKRGDDGRTVWIHDDAVIVRDEDGEPLYWLGIVVDVTVRKEGEQRVREAEEKYRTLVEQIPAVSYIDAIDEVSTALYISPQVEGLLGYSAEERMQKPGLWMEHLHPEDREKVLNESKEKNASGEPFSMDYRMIRRDGKMIWVHDECVLVHDEEGAPLYWQGVMADITDRKDAEAELQRALELEREAGDRLRSLDEMKNTFLTAVSHDLRTPLAAMLGLALTLEREEIGLAPAEMQDLARRIAVNARKLDRLVMDLLDLDRLSRGILEPKLNETDVGFLVQQVVNEADFVGEHPVDVQVESIVAKVDTSKIERMVENLLANAVRHTPPGTQVWVKVLAKDGGVLIAVEDSGPGVLAELKDEIFEPFRQVGASLDNPSPGVGIGLSLVARFAELHGGKAWVEDRDGGGASFRVFLPLEGALASAP
ncbi:MAG: PAS domain-containing protein [Actinomycetota bacterium]